MIKKLFHSLWMVVFLACSVQAAQPNSQLPQYIDLPTRNAIIAYIAAHGGGGGGGGSNTVILATAPIVVNTTGVTNTISITAGAFGDVYTTSNNTFVSGKTNIFSGALYSASVLSPANSSVVNVSGQSLVDQNGVTAFSWLIRQITDSSNSASLSGESRDLYNSSGTRTLNWNTNTLVGAWSFNSTLAGNASLFTNANASTLFGSGTVPYARLPTGITTNVTGSTGFTLTQPTPGTFNVANDGTLVTTSRSISTTAPLTGGGDLSANRTLVFDGTTANINLSGASNINYSTPGTGTIPYARLPVQTVTNAVSVGAGTNVISSLSSGVLSLKSFVQGANITLTSDANTITIAGSAGGGSGNVSTNLNQTYVVGTTQAMDVISWSRSLRPLPNALTSSTSITANRNTAEVFTCTLTNNTTLNNPSNMRSGETCKFYLKAANPTNVVTLAAGTIIPSSVTMTSPFNIISNSTTILAISLIGTNYTVESYIPGYTIPPIP